MSENHIRGISATLALLDKALCEFDQWAQGHEVNSVLYEVRNTISATQRRTIAREVSEMKEMLREIHGTLHLVPSVHSVDKMIAGSCAVLWAWLHELDVRHLRRYGEVPEELAQFLEPKMDALSQRLRHISRVAAGEGAGCNDGRGNVATE